MPKMPSQFYMFATVSLLYFWPWQIFSGDKPADWLASVITLQLVFVIACNIFVRDSWATAIILIEGFCMVINLLMMKGAPIVVDAHEHIVLAAFIIELLIITISLQGVAIGKSNSNRLRMVGNGLCYLRNRSLPLSGRVEVAQ